MAKLLKTNIVLSFIILLLVRCGQNPIPLEISRESSNKGILNGQMANSEMRKNLDSIVYLTMIQGKMAGHCTGTYIGNGMILTAFHCIGLRLTPGSEKLRLKLRPGSLTTSPKELVDADFNVFYPESESFMEVSGGKDKEGKQIKIKVPNPDLAILKINNLEAVGLHGLKAVSIAEKSLQTGDKNLKIAGFGLAPVKRATPPTLIEALFFGTSVPPPTAGTLFFGAVEITSLDTFNYKMLYQNKVEMAAAQPGDSGGPLFSMDNGVITQFGVASFIRTLRVDPITKEATTLLSNYVRLDSDPIQKWIRETLAK